MKIKNILSEIIANKRVEVNSQKRSIPQEELLSTLNNTNPRSMRSALASSQSGIIAEFKRRSPSKGWIKEHAKPELITLSYQESGASALSILTDKTFFGGNLQDISKVSSQVRIPILRKDFIIDEYQLYQTKAIGADAILLIAAALEQSKCRELSCLAHELELEVLLEIHDESELDYITPDIDMVGINNRNLETFETCINNSFRLVGLLPSHVVSVSESGISDPEYIKQLRTKGFRGFLIGETFMKAENPGEILKSFISELN